MTATRFEQALAGLRAWADRDDAQLKDPSKGAHTARAVLLFHEIAGELEAQGKNIDYLVHALLDDDAITVANLQNALTELLGEPSAALARYLDASSLKVRGKKDSKK